MSLKAATESYIMNHGTTGDKLRMKSSGPRLDLRHFCEIDPACQRVLRKTYGEEVCVFENVLHQIKGHCKTNGKISFNETMACATHRRKCSVSNEPSDPRKHEVECAGPICTLWSNRGKREGTMGEDFRVHDAWMHFMEIKSYPITIFENVPQYALDIAKKMPYQGNPSCYVRRPSLGPRGEPRPTYGGHH